MRIRQLLSLLSLLTWAAIPVVDCINPEALSLDAYTFFTSDATTSSPANMISCPTKRCREIVELEFRGWSNTCGGNEEESCEWTVLDLVFTVSKTLGGANRVELTDVQDVPDDQKNAIASAASDGADVLVEISKLADGSGYTVDCRDAFLNGTACLMDDVVEAERRFLRSDVLFVCVSGIATLTFFANYYYDWFLTTMGEPKILQTKHQTILAFAMLANLGIAVSKLFWWNANYDCETRMCQKMVHNGVMTITECVFDFALLYIASKVGVAMTRFDPCCTTCKHLNPCGHLLNHVQRLIGPLVTIAWLCWDTFQARLYAPGNNSLALVAVAFVLQSFVFLSGMWMFYYAFFRRLCCPKQDDPAENKTGEGEVGGSLALGGGGMGGVAPVTASAGTPLAATDAQMPLQAHAPPSQQLAGPEQGVWPAGPAVPAMPQRPTPQNQMPPQLP